MSQFRELIKRHLVFSFAALVLVGASGYLLFLDKQPQHVSKTATATLLRQRDQKAFTGVRSDLVHKTVQRLAASKKLAPKSACSPENLNAIVTASLKKNMTGKLVDTTSAKLRASDGISGLLIPRAYASGIDEIDIPDEPTEEGCSSTKVTGSASIDVYVDSNEGSPYHTIHYLVHTVMNMTFVTSFYDSNCKFQTTGDTLSEDSWVYFSFSSDPECNLQRSEDEDIPVKCFKDGAITTSKPPDFDQYTRLDGGKLTNIDKTAGDVGHCDRCNKKSISPYPSLSPSPSPSFPTTPRPSNSPSMAPYPSPSTGPHPTQPSSPQPTPQPSLVPSATPVNSDKPIPISNQSPAANSTSAAPYSSLPNSY